MPCTRLEPHSAGVTRPRRALLGLLATVVVLTSRPTDAAVLCQHKRSGRVSARAAACARSETAVDLGQLIPAGSVTTPRLADGAVTPGKLSADARAAAGSVVLEGSTSLTSPTVLDSFTVNAPGPGTLLVTVAGMLLIDADAITGNALTVSAGIGLCDTPDSNTQCDGTYSQVWYQDADDNDPSNDTPAFTLTRTVSVAGAGPRVFYVNGEAPNSPGASLGLWKDLVVGAGPVATAVFVPGTLSVTSP
jgi:hypothetical protein